MARGAPNIVLVVTHDTGQHIGPYGVAAVSTPHMDRLAAEGVRFHNSFCTAPQCSPSRASLVTGRYPHCNGVMGLTHDAFAWALNADEQPIARLLSAAGYECILFGRQHATSDPSVLGFDSMALEHDDLAAARRFEQFVRSRGAGKPFYAEVGFSATHRPFDRPGVEPFSDKGVMIPPYLKGGPLTREEFARFQGLIRLADQALGVIADAIDHAGIAEDTILVYTTDHGIPFPRAKCTLYDPGIQVALLLRGAPCGAVGGRVFAEMVSNIDVLPTLLEAAGVAIPERIQGRSFLPLLQGRAYAPRAEVFAEKTFHTYYDPMRAIRMARYKYIHNLEMSQQVEVPSDVQRGGAYLEILADLGWHHPYAELYDLESDPHETRNLSGQAEAAAMEADLRRRLREWMERTSDAVLRGPVASPYYAASLARLSAGGRPAAIAAAPRAPAPAGEVKQQGTILLIENPISGHLMSGRLERLKRELSAGPWPVAAFQTRRAGDAARIAADAPADTAVIVAAGGDGTVSEVISAVRQRDIPLGIVPLGTANLLAREFNVPLDIKGACQLVLRGKWRSVDLGRSERGCFLAVAGAGFDAAVVHRFARSRRGNAAFSSYLQPIIETVSSYPFTRISVELDGTHITDEATAVVVANTSSYAGPFVMARDAKPDDGFFDVGIFYSPDATVYAAHLATVMIQSHDLLPGLDFVRARTVRCWSKGQVPVQLDGEARGFLPITFQIESGAVKLIAP